VRANGEKLRDKLIGGEYEPAPVRGVQIPKPGGKGVRQLGIPTVVDRLVQQALAITLQNTFKIDLAILGACVTGRLIPQDEE
jgi:RNA-directed DNA polymerase